MHNLHIHFAKHFMKINAMLRNVKHNKISKLLYDNTKLLKLLICRTAQHFCIVKNQAQSCIKIIPTNATY